ncbi:MAG: outer membrane beta-barrel protein [Bacteroidetes bacterium]|nr:outer membrane beta-barrel protein [Bacteroidota bacterium]
MNFKFWFLCVFTLSMLARAQAQNGTGKISGVIVDAQNNALPGSTIVLYKLSDTAAKQTHAATGNGSFDFNGLVNGSYSITITHIGFSTYRDDHLSISDAHAAIALPAIILQSNSNQPLKEVVITARRPLVEQRIDRTIVNVDAMVTAAGSNALETLSKSPGVIVDANDNISLNGKSNVLVLIDDRPTYMSGADLAAYLRSLPAGTLDKLELISNPPARYDASGGAVINIVLKKNRAAGFNGNISLGYNQGVYGRSNDALNINYRTTKFNLFSNLGYGLDQNYSKETFSRYFYNTNGALNTAALQSSYYRYTSNAWNGRLGMDYFLDQKTTIGFMVNGSTRPRTDLLNYTNNQYNGNMQLDSSGKGFTGGKYQFRTTGVNLNMQHKFDNSGTQLTADADYVHFYSFGNQLSPVYEYRADGSLSDFEQRLFLLPSDVNIYSGKADFIRPFSGKGEFDDGIKSSYVSNDNQLNWFDGSGHVQDYSRSNHFRYSENINSAYINIRKSWARWGIQAGLRSENTNASGHRFSNPDIADSSFTKTYTHLFPSVYLSYKLDTAGNNNLALSYNQRIRRPGYQQLNPFLFYHDQYSYSTGNPNLLPYYNEYYELRYSYRQYIGITAGYGVGNNESQLLTQANGDVLITRPYNFIDNRTYSLVPYFSFSPTLWWTVRLNAVLLYMLNNGSAGDVTIRQKANEHEIETTNELQLSKDWSAEVDGFFPGKQAFGQSQGNKAGYNISGGIRKTILRGQGTFSFTVNDIFHTFNFGTQTIGINQVNAFSTRETDSRRIGLAFSYRFGKAANARKRNVTGSAEDEKSRTN